jgi:hypothetical protein
MERTTVMNYENGNLCKLEILSVTLKKTELRGRSPQANYTDRATAAYGEVSANLCG